MKVRATDELAPFKAIAPEPLVSTRASNGFRSVPPRAAVPPGLIEIFVPLPPIALVELKHTVPLFITATPARLFVPASATEALPATPLTVSVPEPRLILPLTLRDGCPLTVTRSSRLVPAPVPEMFPFRMK